MPHFISIVENRINVLTVNRSIVINICALVTSTKGLVATLDINQMKLTSEAEEVKYRFISRTPPRVAHTWYRMHGCVVHRGIKTVSREPIW